MNEDIRLRTKIFKLGKGEKIMSRTTDYLMDQEEGAFEKKWRIKTKEILIKGCENVAYEVDPFTEHFIENVCGPLEEGQYHAMLLMAPEGWCMSERCYSNEQLLDHIALCSALKYNVFFSPATFLRIEGENIKWKGADTKHLHHIQCLFVDIDSLDIDVTALFRLGSAEIAEWVHEKYDWPRDMMPNFLVSSGHGMHMYWCLSAPVYVTNESDYKKWSSSIKQLIARFKADSKCINATRMLRVPGSYNLKNGDKIPVNLCELTRKRYSLHQFENISTEEEVSAYWAEIQQARKRNGKEQQQPKRKSRTKKTKHIEIINITPKELKLIPRPDDWDGRHVLMGTIYDLHNWVVRRGCIVPAGYRNTFCMIATTRFKMFNISDEDCIHWLENYLDVDFLDEAKRIVDYIYSHDATIRNATIAEKLCFSSVDYKNSYLIYTDEQRKERKKKTERSIIRAKRANRLMLRTIRRKKRTEH